MSDAQHFFSLRSLARSMCLAGVGLSLLPVIAFVATAVYEMVIPPTDMHLPGLLTAVLILWVAPIGAVLFLLGGLLWIIGVLHEKRKANRSTCRS